MSAITAGQLVRATADIKWLSPDCLGEVLEVGEEGLVVSWWWGGTRLVISMERELLEPAFPPGWDPENQ